ncbi:MAG: cellulase family glycosylhydrolase [Planctomycetes bacterium]|nr:cellulase family glycosylhydrolase [Planctomycetota bacterium]
MDRHLFAKIMLVCALFIPKAAEAGDGTISAPVSVDHRGLLEISGILRGNSEAKWGASNLIIKPYGGWAAQDYCLKNIKKSGGTITADFNTKPAVKMIETIKEAKNAKGMKSYRVSYKLTTTDGAAASYERVYVFFPFASADYAGGKAILDDGSSIDLPKDGAGSISLPHATKSLTITNGKNSFTVKSDSLLISINDLRPKSTSFQICLDYPKPQNVSSMQMDFEVSAEVLPYEVKADGKEWFELPYAKDIEPGSVLDFSFLSDAPAGKHGRIVNKNGHFAYEQTGERVKLIGTNLCYTANYLEKAEADKLADRFRKTGYNVVRFHHTDVHIRKGSWNSQKSDDIDPAYLDKLDYTFAAMKKAGMYVTIDLYTQRRFGKGEIAGVDKVVEGEIKGLVPIHEPAFEAWKKLAVKWLNHVNPYTGLAWKDDPALLSICPLNEDSIFCAWGGVAKPFYLKRFDEWKKEKGLASTGSDLGKDPIFAQFLLEVKMESNRKIEKFLRELGVKAMITGSNWWDTMGQTFTRDQFDLVDNHQYSDHPQPHWLPSKYNQGSNLKSHYTYMTPIFMASTRVFGKPFTVSEYNYCAPNQYRAEGGALMGAYASLQDWDGLFRFAWSHDSKRVEAGVRMSGFDMSSDPISQLSERQIVLMFRRGDVASGTKKYVYGVTMKDATKQGVGDMWGKGIFPHPFNAMALVSQTGSQIVEGERKVTGTFDGVVANDDAVTEANCGGNAKMKLADLPKVGGEVVSDTGQIRFNKDKGYIKVASPKTECIASMKGQNLTADNLSISDNNSFCSVSASSMDAGNLADSGRVLILHLTNVLNSGEKFTSKSMTTLTGLGDLPYIVSAGSVKIGLKNTNAGMKLYACDTSGKRIGEIKTAYADGVYQFTAEISSGNRAMVYELVKE